MWSNKWTCAISSVGGRDGILPKTMWHFATKCAAVKIRQALISSNFSSAYRDPNYPGSTICPECYPKDWRRELNWLHPQESAKRSPKVQTEWLHLRPCLPRFRLEQTEPSDIGESWGLEFFRVLLELLTPQTSPEEKRVWKWLIIFCKWNPAFSWCRASWIQSTLQIIANSVKS